MGLKRKQRKGEEMRYLAKYSPEIGTKSNRTKQKFIRKLKKNIEDAIRKSLDEAYFQESKVKPTVNHIIVDAPVAIPEVLSRIAGLKYFVQVESFDFEGLEDLAEKAENRFRDKVREAGTFAVRCRKTGTQKFGSKTVEVQLGDRLSSYGKVNLDHPGVTCWVEIREKQVYLYHEKHAGMEGVPIGVQGKAMTLFSGGIDSPVAAWFAYRAGLDQDFLYFDLGGEEQKAKAKSIYGHLKEQWGSGSSGRFIDVDFKEVITEVMKVQPAFQNLVLKYAFYYVANQVAQMHSAKALVTGEAVGQVSTQTLQNLVLLDRIPDLMILRPLSTFTKGMIMDYAREIGIYEQAYKGQEYCGLAGGNVVTGVKSEEFMEEVNKIDLTVLDKAVEARAIYDLTAKGWEKVPLTGKDSSHSEHSELDKGTLTDHSIDLDTADVVIDLRAPGSYPDVVFANAHPISFQDAWQEYMHWDKGQTYFLVCEVGSQSKILAHHMRQEGFEVTQMEGGIRRMEGQETHEAG